MLKFSIIAVVTMIVSLGCSSLPMEKAKIPYTPEQKKMISECEVAEKAREELNAKIRAEAKATGKWIASPVYGKCCACLEVELDSLNEKNRSAK